MICENVKFKQFYYAIQGFIFNSIILKLKLTTLSYLKFKIEKLIIVVKTIK